MGILSRFTDIIKSNVNDAIDKMEDPAKMVDQTLRDLGEQLAEVKKETSSVMAEEKRCKRIVEDLQKDLAKYEDAAKKALMSGNEGDAKSLIERKGKIQQELATAENTYNIAKANSDKMQQMYRKLTEDIATLNSKRENIKAQAAMAKAQENINKATASADVSGSMDKFARMEQKAQQRLDAATAAAELNSKPTDNVDDLAAKYASGGSSSVDDELERMKKELGLN